MMGASKLNAHSGLMQLGVVVIGITLLCGCSSVSSLFFGPKTRVWVNNNLYPGTDMFLHCKSKDDDLGVHQIAYDTGYSWSFHDDFFDRTKFVCDIWWFDPNNGGKLVNGTDLNIYKSYRDITECGHKCFRFVKPDGVYFLAFQKMELKYPWPKQ
ncbi:Plant self-incompatibility S1 [Macleaya cordata]|uniref:S-protein homolog n=1 Tax=Macleaya cordata TaxID=56857 RepID=A0A200QS40_MACCD|nr:Plant self-incompatibility S1 [Macleaya cordata]